MRMQSSSFHCVVSILVNPFKCRKTSFARFFFFYYFLIFTVVVVVYLLMKHNKNE